MEEQVIIRSERTNTRQGFERGLRCVGVTVKGVRENGDTDGSEERVVISIVMKEGNALEGQTNFPQISL